MTITLWIPAHEQPRWSVILPLWNLETPDGKKLHIYRSPANNPKYSWNKAVIDFLETKDEWLFSVHSDIIVHPETLIRLLSWEEPLVSALPFMRVGPVLPHIWKKYDNSDGRMVNRITDTRNWFYYEHPEYMTQLGSFVMEPRPANALVEVDFTSTSCVLIHRSVLEKMRSFVKDVWFECDDDYVGGGEDRRFFQNAIEVGFTPYVDRSCIVGHIPTDTPTSVMDFIAWDSASVYMETGEPERVRVNGA